MGSTCLGFRSGFPYKLDQPKLKGWLLALAAFWAIYSGGEALPPGDRSKKILLLKEECSFPCALLSDEAAATSIQSLHLSGGAFHPTSSIGILRRLTCLQLSLIYVTEKGLGLLLSKSSVLEKLDVSFCWGLTCLRIAWTLQQLKYLSFIQCLVLQSVQIDAPNLCSFHSDSIGILTEISVRNSSTQLQNIDISTNLLSAARTKLPSLIRNVESLTLHSPHGEVYVFGFNNILMTKLHGHI